MNQVVNVVSRADMTKPLMMTCSQIAEVCASIGSSKRRDHVMRDARVMLMNLYATDELKPMLPEKAPGRFLSDNAESLFDSLMKAAPTLGQVLGTGFTIERDAQGRISEMWFDKPHAMSLVAKYSDKLRMALIRRIEELEAALTDKAQESAHAIHADERKLSMDLLLIDRFSNLMKIAPSARLRMYHQAAELHGCSTALLPSYAVDAPTDGPQDSSLATDSLRSLLSAVRAHCREKKLKKKVMQAHEFYELLAFVGMADHLWRLSTSKDADGNGRKWFWSIKGDGLRYAKNVTDAKSPRQTQPLFYRDRFDELRRVLAGSVPAFKAHQAQKAAAEASQAAAEARSPDAAVKACAGYAANAPRVLDVREAAEHRDDLR